MKLRSVSCSAVLTAVLGLGMATHLQAQTEESWSVYQSLQGSFNSGGDILRFDTDLGYRINEHLSVGVGVPVYLVRAGTSDGPLGSGWNTGLGNVYLDLELSAGGTEWFVASGLTAAAPTGDRDRGFSTGKLTVDWTNSVAYYLPRATLFGSAGLANTVSDTSFFVRPFTTTGLVGHFDAGLFLPFNPWLGLGVLGYAVQGGGEQQVRSRLIASDRLSDADRRRLFESRVETRGQDLADDHGFSAWIDLVGGGTSFQLGYTRSVPYAYDTAFFTVGFDVLRFFR